MKAVAILVLAATLGGCATMKNAAVETWELATAPAGANDTPEEAATRAIIRSEIRRDRILSYYGRGQR